MSIGLGIGVQRPKQLRSIYSVNGKVPGFTADFIKNKYPGHTSLSSAITHARAGNATMTDGYGPELVVNGGFDSDVSGWTANSNAVITYNSGEISVERVSSANDVAYQIVATEIGKLYEVNFGGSSPDGLRISNDTNFLSPITTSTPTVSPVTFIATSTTTYVGLRGTTGTPALYDNVSVREMPVIKWAPHNLCLQSEDLTPSWSLFRATLSTNAITSPDGTQTAYGLIATAVENSHGIYQPISIEAGVGYSWSVFAKAGDKSWFRLEGYSAANGNVGSSYFNLSTGEKGSTSGSVTSSITDVGNGWYLCSMKMESSEFTSSGLVSFYSYPVDGDGDNLFTGDGSTVSAYIWGAHLYRSDLGGMAANPDQPPSRSSYVPTTSSAVYLPRVGHHVYNGSAWVNEGVLAESEARTNLVRYSQDFTDSYWTENDTGTLAIDAVGPDGQTSAVTLVDSGGGGNATPYIASSATVSTSTRYTLSCFMKKGGVSWGRLRIANAGLLGLAHAWFDLSSGSVGHTDSAVDEATIQDFGNGWYRCAITFTTDATDTSIDFRLGMDNNDNSSGLVAADGTSSILIYGAQVEAGSTPSSLIPTAGSSVSRAAETFTIPSANLPWPTPQYIGSELVTNGTFDTDTTGWSTAGGTISLSSVSGELEVDGDANTFAVQNIALTSGKVYRLTGTARLGTHDGTARVYIGTALAAVTSTENTDVEIIYVATSSSANINLRLHDGVTGGTAYFDNISVREINPLSVSIGMEGRMTYADEDNANNVVYLNWEADGSNFIRHRLDTRSTDTGQVQALQTALGVSDTDSSGETLYSPDVLVPFNIAGRHGSTFVEVAADGNAFAPNTTPTALPDLSSTDLNLAHVYMGTISEFRVWDRDLGDAGIVEATNPSLEPSLSLTFEGTGTNSFVVNNWSE